MTRRERLIATLRGEPVDRPAVSFYEIGGFSINRDDPDAYNIYNAPSWQPLLDFFFPLGDLRWVDSVLCCYLVYCPLFLYRF